MLEIYFIFTKPLQILFINFHTVIFFHPFSFHLFLSLYLKYIFISSLWLEMHFLKIQSDKLCHLLEVFQPFIFSVIIDTIRFNLAILLFIFLMFPICSMPSFGSNIFMAKFYLFHCLICCNSSLWYFRLRILQEICLSYEVVFEYFLGII